MEDKEYSGGIGIDTKRERDAINYVPNIQPTDKRSTGGNTDEELEIGLEPDTSLPYPVSDAYIHVGETYEFITTLVEQLQEEFKNTYIPVSGPWINRIIGSNVDIPGLDTISPSKGIPFELYDESILHPDNPTYALIQEAVEEYAEDVDGNIKLELYPDAKEMQLNLEELHYLLGNTLYSHFVDSEQIPPTPKLDDTFYEAMKSQEGKQQEAFTALTNLHSLNESLYYELLTTAYESEDYFNALEAFQTTKREHDDFSRRMNQQTEFVDFANVDAGMTKKCARRINRQIIKDSEVEQSAVESILKKQYADDADYRRACAQMKTATKLQINRQIEEKKQRKDALKTTGGLAMKKRVHDEVVNLTNIRNDVFLDLYGMMNNMVEPTRVSEVEAFFDQVAEGMELVRDNYKVYLQEMYQIHMIDQEIRFDKVNLTGDKQIARDGYWLLDNLLK